MAFKKFDTKVQLRITTADKEALERVSKARGVNASEYLRGVVREDDRRLSGKGS